MRKIKFRGMNLCGKWVYGDLRHDLGCMPDGKLKAYISVCGEPVHPKSVGQFTGLKDCKGQEIFEGDILRYLPPWRWVDTKKIGIVVFQNYGFYVKNEYVTDSLFNIAVNSDGAPFEVIGNVYDNPDLLEATE